MSNELAVGKYGELHENNADELEAAIEAASSQDQITWITADGKRIAAVVPVDIAEAHEAAIERVLRTPVGRRVQFPQVTVELTGQDSSTGVIIARVAEAMRAAGLDERTIRNTSEAIIGAGSYADVIAFLLHTVNVK